MDILLLVALQDDDLAVGAGDRRAGRAGKRAPYRAAGPEDPSRCGRARSVSARNERLVGSILSTMMVSLRRDAENRTASFSGVSVPVGGRQASGPGSLWSVLLLVSACRISAVSGAGTLVLGVSSWTWDPGRWSGWAVAERRKANCGLWLRPGLMCCMWSKAVAVRPTGGGDRWHRHAPGPAGDACGVRRACTGARPGHAANPAGCSRAGSRELSARGSVLLSCWDRRTTAAASIVAADPRGSGTAASAGEGLRRGAGPGGVAGRISDAPGPGRCARPRRCGGVRGEGVGFGEASDERLNGRGCAFDVRGEGRRSGGGVGGRGPR